MGEVMDITENGPKALRPARKRPGRPVAVALEYDPAKAGLPKVVASGRGSIAEQILNVAFANGIKVREDADLVEILAAIDVDTEIPLEAIVTVAEILAYVYRANGRPVPVAPTEEG